MKLGTTILLLLGPVAAACDSERRTLEDLRQGMPYSEAREIILDAGWQAVAVRWQDRGELYGRDSVMVEDRGWTEMQVCSGTGMAYCFFEFQNAMGEKLVVQTAGEEDDPAVEHWRIE
jgi:hypothetical protein